MWKMVQDGKLCKCCLDLSNVVKGKDKGKEYNDWKNSKGCKIGVRYKWHNDEWEERWFEIVDYNTKTRKLTLKWNENEYFIMTNNLQKGQCGNIFDKVTSNFKNEIGQVVNGLTLIEKYHKENKKGQQEKWYKYRCEKGHVHEIDEGHLKVGVGCSICSGKTVLKGYNDLATTHPDSVPYFPNPEDATKYTAHSNKKVTLKCPLCGKEKTMKIQNFIRYGFSCPNCSDGVPLTEKFMSNLLFSKNIEYIAQASKNNFEWIKDNRLYDFALPTYKTMIEIDGDLRSHGDRTTDNFKDEMALNNGWSIIRINLLEEKYIGSFEQLWNKYKQVLNNLGIRITDEEAKECYVKSQNSIFNLIVEIANDNTELSQREIANKLKEKYGYQLNKGTISRYLKCSNELGLTNYKAKDEKQVIGINIENPTITIEYPTMNQAKKDGFNHNAICNCCKGNKKSYKGYYWFYKEDFEKLSKEEINKIKNEEVPNGGRPKAVICITTGEIYESCSDTGRKIGISRESISKCCRGKSKYTKHPKTGEKLVWMYLEDFLKMMWMYLKIIRMTEES